MKNAKYEVRNIQDEILGKHVSKHYELPHEMLSFRHTSEPA